MAAQDDAKDNSKVGQMKKLNTIRNISELSDVCDYPVGFTILEWEKQTHLSATYFGENWASKLGEYNVPYYFLQTLVFVCRGDGVLGEREKAWILRACPDWGIKDEKVIDDILKGKNCLDEYLKLLNKMADECCKNEKDKAKAINASKVALIAWAVAASCQDGIVREEINVVYDLADSMKVDRKVVKQLADVLRLEQQIAKIMLSFEDL